MEILAPAGNMKALKSAVAAGADAVYLGAGDFNARSKAENFGKNELRLAISYCHDRGVRVYLTLNTLVKSQETEKALSEAKDAADAGVDAFIVQDLALALKIQKLLPDMPLHASTQMGIHNAYGAAFAKKAGFDRIIFSRESLPADILQSKEATNLETEFFVHGAHCVSFSGNCYFSALVSGYSGNRGKCLQLCRKRYTLTDGNKSKTGYMLSAKDICLLKNLSILEKAGIDSLKIEGRLRSPEYVSTVTEAYRKALDGKVPDITNVKTVFNRGDYSQAYVIDDRPDIIYDLTQNNIGSYTGNVTDIKGNTITVKGYKSSDGDGFKILRHGKEAGSAVCKNGKIFYTDSVKLGDEVRLTKKSSLERRTEVLISESDKREKIENFKVLSRKNHSSISDIVLNSYDLPCNNTNSCVILRVNEYTDKRLYPHADIIILSPALYDANKIKTLIKDFNKPALLELPVEARGKDCDILLAIKDMNIFDGYVANNIYALEMFGDKPLVCGEQMNFLSEYKCTKIISEESAVAGKEDIVPIFMREIFMNLTHCPSRQLGYTCGKCTERPLYLIDENRNQMPLRRKKLYYCYHELLNSKIKNISDRLNRDIHKRLLIDARNIDGKKVYTALKDPYNLRFDEKTETRGRWGKGVK